MRPAILSAALAIAFTAGVSAQDKPNFAGTWKASGSFNSWTIAVEGKKMTVTMTVAGNSESNVYLLDGTPSKKQFEGPNGPMENVSTSTWEGDVLVTTTKTGFGSTMIERRSLEPDGTMRIQNTLIMEGKPPLPPGPGMVLKKVETGVSRQDKPNFVGTWKPDPARSKTIGGLGPTQTITVEGSKMTITRTVAGNSASTVFLLDGTPSKNVSGPPDKPLEITYTSKWEGTVLVTTWSSPTITNIERRSIEADGTMKVEVAHHLTQESRTETSTRVFNKVKGQ